MPKRRSTQGTVLPEVAMEMLRHQIDLLRLEGGARVTAVRVLNNLLGELTAALAEHDLTKFSKARLNVLLGQATDTIDQYYANLHDKLQTTLTGVAEVQAAHVGSTLDEALAVVNLSAGLPTETYLERIASNAVVMGAPSEEWWARQAKDTAFRFANAVRQGLVAGDTTETIVARVAGRQGYPGIMDISRANARSLVHTSIQEVANEARMETFQQNADVIEGVMQLSTLDSNTTDICIAYDQMEWTLDGDPIDDALPFDGGPPRHWGCRSILVPVTKTFKELGVDAPEPKGGTRASEDGPVPLATTFEKFLDGQTEEQQDEQLGAGRAQLWRDGTITLPQLLDLRGNPLTLEELQSRYG